ncbi:hypothetical protein FRC18_008852 [Serendipita sp. 400]|nr:hypothetical protein FRC18_008852 [Serendipita sp. 400]
MSNDPLLLWSIHQINHPTHYYQTNRPSEFDGLSQPLTQYPIPLAGPPRLISGNPGIFSVNDSFAPTTSTSSIVIPTPPIVNPIVNRSVPSPSSPGLSRNTSSRHRASQVHQRRQSTAVTSSSTIEMTRPLRITRRQTESKAQQSVPRQHQPPPSSSPTVPKSPQSPQSSPLSLSPSPPTFSSRKRSTPFNCNWCAYVFPRRRDRDRHERSIHTRQAPYACLGGCNLAFVRTDARLRHWRANQQCYEEHVRVVLDSNETHL